MTLKRQSPQPITNELCRPGSARAALAPVMVALLLQATACSDPGQRELFEGTQVSLAANVGDECDLGHFAADPDETIVEDQHPACGSGYCLWRHPDIEPGTTGVPGFCTCRCDGPENSGPYCACPESYVCVQDVIEDLGSDHPSVLAYVGAYCMRE